ncbi:hypothetical protein Cantr_03688 [Candida viswanathii]|uniref:Uncharacterized protein n=1 Tax=Candida viswanathii TaxID=5486 RepID=A0A367XL47_9ASCO|nr:hypothetical protein Cantr_03688 [Candida viswanathii]
MSDFAFNNYCIHCDKICPTSSIYCSDECKSIEHSQNSISNTTTTTTTTSNLQQSQVSPLLTPMLYIQQQQLQAQQAQQQLYQVNSPLQLSNDSEELHDDDDLNYFDLNYSVQSNINYTNNNDLINSTSHNYRKWLTTASSATAL